MSATTRCLALILTAATGACAGGREAAAPPRPAANAEDILGTARSVQPPLAPEPRWVRIDSAESRTLWLDTASIGRVAADALTVLTAFRFATPRPSRSGGRTYVEARLRHRIECSHRRMRTLEFDTRDAAGAVVEAGRLDSEWLRPFEGSGYANLINLVCEYVQMSPRHAA